MSDHSRLLELNAELGKVFEEMQLIASEHRSIMISTDAQFNESFGMVMDGFEPKLDHFRSRVTRIADKFPRQRRNRSKKNV